MVDVFGFQRRIRKYARALEFAFGMTVEEGQSVRRIALVQIIYFGNVVGEADRKPAVGVRIGVDRIEVHFQINGFGYVDTVGIIRVAHEAEVYRGRTRVAFFNADSTSVRNRTVAHRNPFVRRRFTVNNIFHRTRQRCKLEGIRALFQLVDIVLFECDRDNVLRPNRRVMLRGKRFSVYRNRIRFFIRIADFKRKILFERRADRFGLLLLIHGRFVRKQRYV